MENEKKKKLDKSEKKAVKKAVKKQVKKLSGKHSAALSYSAYVRTILDAVNNPGVKIPDEITTPSYTVQVLTKFLLTTAAGTAPNTQVGAGFGRILGKTITSAGYSVYQPNNVASQYAGTSVANPWAASLASQARSVRLVSAKATMQYLGAPNNASGRFLLSFVPPNDPLLSGNAATGIESAAITPTILAQEPLVADVPASKLYAECRYLPTDPISRSYELINSTAVGTNRNPASALLCTYGGFWGMVDGAPAGQSVEVNIWENYEVVPLNNLVNLAEPTPSHSDPLELAAASNLISDVPQMAVLQGPDQARGTAQAANGLNATTAVKQVEENDEPSFMDKMFSGLNMAVDVGKKALPIASAVAALL